MQQIIVHCYIVKSMWKKLEQILQQTRFHRKIPKNIPKIHIMETKENQKTEERPEKNEELEKNETETETIEISDTESDISSTRYRFSRT